MVVRATNEVRDALRATQERLTRLNHRVARRLGLRDTDFDVLDLLATSGPATPSRLAAAVGVHPATLTGILDRLEKAGWITRAPDPGDRRAIAISAAKERMGEVFREFDGMGARLDRILADYDAAQLATISDFLRRTSEAGAAELETLAD